MVLDHSDNFKKHPHGFQRCETFQGLNLPVSYQAIVGPREGVLEERSNQPTLLQETNCSGPDFLGQQP